MPENLKNTSTLEVSAEELRVNLANYLGQVTYADKVVVVKRYNRDAAVILSPRMLKRIVESGSATPEDRKTALQQLDALVNQIPDIDPDQFEPVVQKAVQEVRARKRKRK
jgi:prevent-host-death family protein